MINTILRSACPYYIDQLIKINFMLTTPLKPLLWMVNMRIWNLFSYLVTSYWTKKTTVWQLSCLKVMKYLSLLQLFLIDWKRLDHQDFLKIFAECPTLYWTCFYIQPEIHYKHKKQSKIKTYSKTHLNIGLKSCTPLINEIDRLSSW